ncbi:hypothetical protein ACRAWF_20010 [Streptomyces sp. L7]
MLQTDPPDHTRLRRLVAGHFTPAQIPALRPAVKAIATVPTSPLPPTPPRWAGGPARWCGVERPVGALRLGSERLAPRSGLRRAARESAGAVQDAQCRRPISAVNGPLPPGSAPTPSSRAAPTDR